MVSEPLYLLAELFLRSGCVFQHFHQATNYILRACTEQGSDDSDVVLADHVLRARPVPAAFHFLYCNIRLELLRVGMNQSSYLPD